MTSTDQTTPLTELHIKNGAKMVPFAGYLMPVQYPLGILKEHLHTREKAGLFDVSHMGQAWVQGENAAEELESMIPIDVVDLASGQQRYGFFTNNEGGIEDDLMVSRSGDKLFLVVNAACKDSDFKRLQAGFKTSELIVIEDRALLALQGPKAKDVLERFGLDLTDMPFMSSREVNIKGINCFISRSGYTGEDGFEISVLSQEAEAFALKLQADEDVEWIGLGARDTLRLEGGMCLYGHDIDTQTTPVEAAISWAISPARRLGGIREGGFPGAHVILPQIGKKQARKRVGLQPTGRAPIREGVELIDENENIIGMVTSGGFSPSLQKPIAMGYVNAKHNKINSKVFAKVRNKIIELTVTSPTFVPNNFYRT